MPSAEDRSAVAVPNPGFPRRRRGECPDLEIGMTCTTQVTGSTTRRDGIESFVSGIRGAVLRPEDPGYIDRRLHAAMHESPSGGLC